MHPGGVLFVLPPGGQAPYFSEHLGAAFLRAVLERASIATRQYTPERNVGLATFGAFLQATRPSVVGFTAYESNLRACRALAGVVRETLPESVVVAGGPNATFTPEDTLERLDADVCLRGAGEGTIVALTTALLGATSPRRALETHLGDLPNLVLRCGVPAVHTRLGDLSSFPAGFGHLDELPSPYAMGLVESADLGLLTARGCNQHCTYCSFATISGRRVHFHSVERVLDDLEALAHIARRGPRRDTRISVFDDAFTLSPERARHICEGIIARRLRLSLACETRVDRVDRDLLRLMKRAGFGAISFGVDSAVPHVLRAIGKVQHPRTTSDPAFERERAYIADVRQAVAEAKRAGLEPSVSIIGGLPGETAADLAETLAFVESLEVGQYAHNSLTVLPGTPLFAARREHDLDAWRDRTTGAWRTRLCYDVSAVPPVRGSYQTAARRDEAEEITDALCGRERPERAGDDAAWAVVLHGCQPDDALARWLSRVTAVHSTIVALDGGVVLDEAAHERWLAALERACVAWGRVAVLAGTGTSRAGDEMLTVGTPSRHELTVSARLGALPPGLSTDAEGNCRVPVWLASRSRSAPPASRVDLVAGPSPQVADGCRFCPAFPQCSQPAVLHVWSDGRVTACWGGPPLGAVGDDYRALTERGRRLLAGRANGCPLPGRPSAGEIVARLEVASVVAWALQRDADVATGGLVPWQPRSPPSARSSHARRSRRSAPERRAPSRRR